MNVKSLRYEKLNILSTSNNNGIRENRKWLELYRRMMVDYMNTLELRSKLPHGVVVKESEREYRMVLARRNAFRFGEYKIKAPDLISEESGYFEAVAIELVPENLTTDGGKNIKFSSKDGLEGIPMIFITSQQGFVYMYKGSIVHSLDMSLIGSGRMIDATNNIKKYKKMVLHFNYFLRVEGDENRFSFYRRVG